MKSELLQKMQRLESTNINLNNEIKELFEKTYKQAAYIDRLECKILEMAHGNITAAKKIIKCIVDKEDLT